MMMIRGTDGTGAAASGLTVAFDFVNPTTAVVSGTPNFLLATIARLNTGSLSTAQQELLAQHLFIDENTIIIDDNFPTRFGSGDTITIPVGQATLLNSAVVHETLYPADRCTWRQHSLGARGYGAANVQFYPGNAAAIDIVSAELGYIGKSGRFVEIAG